MTEQYDPGTQTDLYEAPDNPHHDDEDYATAINAETDDGKGGAVVPKEDFESYTDPTADEDVL